MEEQRSEGGSKPPGRRGAKPCRNCGETHWHVFEDTPGSGVWYARVWYRGAVHKNSVGPHGLALKVAAKWLVQIAEGRFFPETRTVSDEPLTDAIKAYLAERTDLGGDWRRIARNWMQSPEVKGKGVRDFSTTDAETYLKRLEAAGRKPSTRNKPVTFLHTFYERYEDRRRRDRKRRHTPPVANPLKGLRASENNERVRWLTDEEEDRLRAQLPDAVDWTIVLVALHTAARRGNVFALKWTTDVRFQPYPAIRRWSRKGRRKLLKEDWIPVNDELLDALRALPSRGRSEWVFPNARGTGPIDPKNWYRRVYKPALKAAGVVDFTFHDLKHTVGTRLRAEGVAIEDIAPALQHADTRMSLRYSHIAPGRLAEVMAKLSRRGTDRRSVRGADEPETATSATPGATR